MSAPRISLIAAWIAILVGGWLWVDLDSLLQKAAGGTDTAAATAPDEPSEPIQLVGFKEEFMGKVVVTLLSLESVAQNKGIAAAQIAVFIDELASALPSLTWFGLRMFLIIIALSPLFIVGRFATMAGLGEADRDRVIGTIGHSNIYLVRQMVLALKATFAMFFAGGEELQAVCRGREPDRSKLVALGRKTAA